MYASVDHKSVRTLNGSTPSDCVIYNFLNVGIKEGSAILVTGMEVEYLSKSASEGCAASHNVTVLIPRREDKIIRLRDKEGLAIHFLEDIEVGGDAFGDGMRGIHVPYYAALISAPREISRSAEGKLKRL